MKILHVHLKPFGTDYAEFRYFWDNPNNCQSHQIPLAEIADLIQKAETDYYTRLPEDYAKTGQTLYNWLDGSDRILQRALDQHRHSDITVLAISTSERLAHLPWEILHDGECFLIERKPAIVPVRWVAHGRPLTLQNQPANRALNVLFMAASPLGIEPKLDFEAEEANILKATKRSPLHLRVEESGCLTELGYLIKEYETGYFDVVHLTGHASEGFITETEYGEPAYSSAEDIATALQHPMPKLIFLSGCRTGYSMGDGSVSSMAEALLNQGATAVLGWGQKVLDVNATKAAFTLYQELSHGNTVTAALSLTYKALLGSKARDWHLLRLYVAETLPESLVTHKTARGRKPAPNYSRTLEFRDPQGKLRVATREDFVGRRRQLQNCLRALKIDSDKVGVLIQGMGGLGKSTIASRLWERLAEHEKIILWRQIDESSLVNQLADKLRNSEQRKVLKESQESLKYRLRNLFCNLKEAGEKPFLAILDDFEWNLEPRQGRYFLNPEAAEVLDALVWAIQQAGSEDRIIVTCRYEFQSDLLKWFYIQRLDSLSKSDLDKKLSRLHNFESEKIGSDAIGRALRLADGNPRLLEWLNDEVLSGENPDLEIRRLEVTPKEWKGRIIWDDLYKQIDLFLARILSHCLVFEIPVPMSALEYICKSIPNYKEELSRAVELGLIEVSPPEPIPNYQGRFNTPIVQLYLLGDSSRPEDSEECYRVSRILSQIIPSTRLPDAPELYSLYRQGHKKLYQLWGNYNNLSEERWREIFRMQFAAKNNPMRFKNGFCRMLYFQTHQIVDDTYKEELRKNARYLFRASPYIHLIKYLQKHKWREADLETTFIFYQVMAIKGYESWEELLQNFPSQTLDDIDRLWLKYSEGHFGFSVQKRIWKNLRDNIGEFDYDVMGWMGRDWPIKWGALAFTKDCPPGNLPAHWTRTLHDMSTEGGWAGRYYWGCITSEHCDLLFSRDILD